MGNCFGKHILTKRFFSLLLALVVILSMFFTETLYAPLSTTVKATSAVTITVSPTKCTLYVGQSKTLKTTVKNTNSKVSYSSSNKAVATVDSKGKITAKSKGTATITAKVAGKSAKCVVKVKDVVIRLNSTQKILYVDSTYQLKATVTGSSKAVSWKSSNMSIATVSNNGLVTAKKNGTAKITARVEKTTVTCVITVKDIVITLSRKDFILFNAESVSITAKVVGSSKSPVWKSFNPGLVTVSGSGNTVNITAKKAGTAKISATLGNTTVYCIVRIYDYVSKIELSTNKVEIYPNQKYQVKAKVYPDTAYYKDVTWSISDKTVASIEKGCITAIKPGTCTIRATSQDKKKVFAECNLTVHQPVTSISFAQSSYELYKCSKLKIKPTVKPDNAFNKKVRYVVNDPTVGKISETGEIQPYRIGTLTVRCYACDGQGAYGVFKVNIRQNIDYLSFDKEKVSLGTGLTYKLKAHISPENAYNKKLKYVSSNKNVVTVNKYGVIKGVNQGKAKVMTLSTDGSKHQCYCNISVFVSAKKLRISGSTKITVNHKYTNFKLSAYPKNSYLNKVKWYSSNPKVATVDNKGKVRIHGLGTTKIYIINKDGSNRKSNTVYLKVYKVYIKSIKLSKKQISMAEGKKTKIKITIYPKNATEKKVKWYSTNNKVATVNGKGYVKLKIKGRCNIICKAQDGSKKQSVCNIRVKRLVNKIALNYKTATLWVGHSFKLKPHIYPSSADNKGIKWYSTNNKIATVSSSGKVIARSRGTCYIKAKAKDGSKKEAYCYVNTKQRVTSIHLSKKSKTLYKSAYFDLHATAYPSNADNRGIKWYSTNNKVATVSSKGKVSVKGKGSCYIVAQSKDGFDKKAKCKINVYGTTGKKIGKNSYAWVSGVTETNYHGYVLNLSSSSRYIVKKYIACEAGYSGNYNTYCLLAQCVHDSIISEGVNSTNATSVENIIYNHFPTYRNKSKADTYNYLSDYEKSRISKAVKFIFDNGGTAVSHTIRYAYNGRAKITSEQKKHTNILNYGNEGYLIRYYN